MGNAASILKTKKSAGHEEIKQKPLVLRRLQSSISGVFSPREAFVVEHYLPVFCIMNPVLSPRIGELTKMSWERVVSGEAQGFKKVKEKQPELTSLIYFYDRFYHQLFFLYPEVRHFFQSSIASQGRRLVKSLMGLATIVSYDSLRVCKKLTEITERHNQLGIHPMFYGGFMWNIIITLRHCLDEDWTQDIEEAWVTSASFMLRVMIPIAVRGTRHFASPYVVPRQNTAEFHVTNTPEPDPLTGFTLPIADEEFCERKTGLEGEDFCMESIEKSMLDCCPHLQKTQKKYSPGVLQDNMPVHSTEFC